ncbi:MAG TPA: heavy-metal-associated domain-containing protein [Burkholderiaceae bacterium]|nr:heavy-metal-associated domain-containing protein [Burkholderiaceae bacterium]
MATTTLTVRGMTCAHCAVAVSRALQAVPGVESAQVSLDRGQAVVSGSADVQRLIQAVEAQGYRAQLPA